MKSDTDCNAPLDGKLTIVDGKDQFCVELYVRYCQDKPLDAGEAARYRERRESLNVSLLHALRKGRDILGGPKPRRRLSPVPSAVSIA